MVSFTDPTSALVPLASPATRLIMQLLLIRHAIAGEREEFAASGKADSERPLTEYGRRRMAKNARGLRRISPRLDVIVSSPYLRAKDTARIVANTLGAAATETTELLTPDRHPRDFFAWLATQPTDSVVAAVGHEPHLSRLLHWSIAQKAETHAEFKKGGVALVDFDGAPKAGDGVLRWLLTPAQLRSIAD